jgi:hypothetical protein
LAEILERFAWSQLAVWSESQPALGLAAERRRDRGWHGFSRHDRARVEQNQKPVPCCRAVATVIMYWRPTVIAKLPGKKMVSITVRV